VDVKTYQMQFYPDSFKDYMFGTATETNSEYYSLLGTGDILDRRQWEYLSETTRQNGIQYGTVGTHHERHQQQSALGGKLRVSHTARV
jgi:hypothetical protein